LEYDDLEAETSSTGRVYTTPTGTKYPSITTVLSILSEDGIRAWRQRVGEEEATRISTRAANRGTAVHSITERYINNEVDYAKDFMPNIIGNFTDLKSILDERLNNIRAQEVPLYSDHLRVAGRVDCVGEFDGILSIVDFKTSRKLKKKEWITNYFAQEAAYAIMWEERTGEPITQLVTLITVDNEQPQVFIEHRDNWTELLLKTRDEYERRKLFGH
tara:strand:+ start:290 stop:940 length:651 start_codon:yes stop_codon:yes gene_type:complete